MNPDETLLETPEDPKWLPERLERAKRQALQTLLDDLGFPDVDGLKATLQAQSDQLLALVEERNQVLIRAEQAETARQTAYLEAAFTAEAARYRFYDAEEARRLLDWSGVQVNEAGQVVGLREALHALVDSRPHLIRRSAIPQTDSTLAGSNSYQPDSVQEMSADQVEALKRRFKLW